MTSGTRVLASAALMLICASSASARTFTVVTDTDAPAPAGIVPGACTDLINCTSTLPSGECTLRAAVQWANTCPGPDVIELDAPGGGTYALTVLNGAAGPEDVADRGDLDVLEEVRVVGIGASPDMHVVDGLGSDRVFHAIIGRRFEAGIGLVTSWLTLENLTVLNGVAGDGGCIRGDLPGSASSGLGVRLSNAVVKDCDANSFGGGIYMSHGTDRLEVLDSSIEHNIGRADGGGVWSGARSVRMTDSTVNYNTGWQDGGGVYARSGGVAGGPSHSYHKTDFFGNVAGRNGGAIYSAEEGNTLEFSEGRFVGNTAGVAHDGSAGGAVYTEGPITVERSDLTHNALHTSAHNRGGAIFAMSTWRVEDSSLNDNRVGWGDALGGALYVLSNGAAVGSSFSSNHAELAGGAVFVAGGESETYHCSFANNTANEGGAIFVDTSAATHELGRSLMGDNGGARQCDGTTSVGFNVSEDPDCASAGLADDNSSPLFTGTANATFAFDVLTIDCSSPAVDRVPHPFPAGPTVLTDVFGTARPQGPASDSGAMEVLGCL